MQGDYPVARVYLLDVPYHIDKLYDYYIPEELRGTLAVGGFAAVPFGGGNRRQLAMVGGFAGASDCEKLKPVISPVCGNIVLDGEMLGLCLYMKEHFLCTVGDAVKAMIPAAALTKVKDTYSALPVPEGCTMTPRQEALYRYVTAKGSVSGQTAVKEQGPSVLPLLSKMTVMGLLRRESEFSESRAVMIETAGICPEYRGLDGDSLSALVRGEKQKAALSALGLCGSLTVTELRDRYGVPMTALKSLVSKNIVSITKENAFRDPYKAKVPVNPVNTVLSEEQERAKDEIMALVGSGKASAALLHGVTGSGKTSVIRAVMDEVIASGKSVIMLVPEIALTPQTVGFFRACYGDRTAVIHSGLSKGERWDAWRKISDGEADVCIGTRSAVFAPFKNLGLIVLDEEQEHTYKSDMDPKYHARDIARYRCAKQNAVMLLASATPSVESYSKAKSGKYRLVTLSGRYGNAVLPDTVITDMRKDTRSGMISPIGSELRARLKDTLEKHEQAILFINQRGYNRFLSCPLCGNVIMCRQCSVSMTYHTVPYAGRGYLFCHYCGAKEPVPDRCPQCGNETMKYVGCGTQLVEEELKKLFPEARVIRMDADTTRTKFAYEELLGSFREGGADILIGTQMVTKGHDFPNVTLVGVLNADSSLYLSDYKANERTFDIITQVIGRAGRGDKPGCALVQTYNPDHPVLRMAAEQNYEKMYAGETALRKSLVFPPYCDIVMFTLSSESENELMSACREFSSLWSKTSSANADIPTVMFGPMEAPVYKVGGIYRMRAVIKCRMDGKTRGMISGVYSELSRMLGRKIGLSVDINPNSL